MVFQFWSAYVPCGAQFLDAVQLTMEQIDVINRLISLYNLDLQLATSVKGKTLIIFLTYVHFIIGN